MNEAQGARSLPLKNRLSAICLFSFVIATLMAAASVAGLRSGSSIYPATALRQAFVPNDVVILFIGLPALLGSMWLAWRGRLVGLLCWGGALLFVAYNYTAYIFAMPLNWAFLVHVVLAVLSVYTLIGLAASVDGESVRRRLNGTVAERFAGGTLVCLGSLFLLRAISVIAAASASGAAMPEPELGANVADIIITPAWVIGGVLLWQRKALGYVAGLGLLFQGSMLFVALIILLLLQPVLTATPLAATDLAVISVMGLICFVPFGLFVRGVLAAPGTSEKLPALYRQ